MEDNHIGTGICDDKSHAVFIHDLHSRISDEDY